MTSEIEAIQAFVVAQENFRAAVRDGDTNHTTMLARHKELQARYEGLKDILRDHK